MLSTSLAGKLKKRASTRKVTDARKQKMREELFEQIAKNPGYKDAIRGAQSELHYKWEDMEGASKYEVGLWIDLHTRAVLEAGMDLVWCHVGDDQDQIVKFKNAAIKAEERCTLVQKRALQEVTSLRDKYRRLPDDLNDRIENVEFYNALDFVEPEKRHLMQCIIREELKKLVLSGGDPKVAEDHSLQMQISTLKMEAEEKKELLENVQADAKRVQARAREMEQSIDNMKEKNREEIQQLSALVKKLREELKERKGSVCEDVETVKKINPVMYNPCKRKYVAWLTMTEDEGASLGDHDFQHTSEMEEGLLGDIGASEGPCFVAFSVERDTMAEARRDSQMMAETLAFSRKTGEPPTALVEAIRELHVEEDLRIRQKYESESQSRAGAGDPEEEARLKTQLAEMEDKLRIFESAAAAGAQGDSGKIVLKVSSLERQLAQQEEEREKLSCEKQKEVDGRVFAERLVEKKNAEIEALKRRYETDVAALQVEAPVAAVPTDGDAAQKFQKEAKVATENYEKLQAKFSEMETSLKGTNEKLESEISHLLAESKGKQNVAEEKELSNSKLTGKLSRVENKFKTSQREVEKLQLQLGELQVKLGSMRNEFIKKNGGAEGFEELLECVGLKDFVDNSSLKRIKVFDRLYEDALRRLRRLEELSFKIHEKERLAIARVMDSRLTDSSCFLRNNGPVGSDDEKKLLVATETQRSILSTSASFSSRSQSPHRERDECRSDRREHRIRRHRKQQKSLSRSVSRSRTEFSARTSPLLGDSGFYNPGASPLSLTQGTTCIRSPKRRRAHRTQPVEDRSLSTPRMSNGRSEPVLAGCKRQDSSGNVFCFAAPNILVSRTDIQIRQDRDATVSLMRKTSS